MPSDEPLSFAEFQSALSDLLQVDVGLLQPEAYLVTDLGVDSIRLVELLLQLEERGLALSLEQFWEVQTVADAYRCYRQQVGL
jgi:acyl carrier protein